jgi:hypothetical protein
LRTRLPSRQELLPVFATCAFFVFSWTLYRMFWYVPSWLEYLSVWSVLSIAAYLLAFALLESACLAGFTALFGLLFPRRLFRERFTALGSSLAGLMCAGAFLVQRRINLVYRLELWQLIVYPLAALVGLALAALLLSGLFGRFPRLQRTVESLAERMTIFAYLYIPLGILGLAVVIVRNLIGG